MGVWKKKPLLSLSINKLKSMFPGGRYLFCPSVSCCLYGKYNHAWNWPIMAQVDTDACQLRIILHVSTFIYKSVDYRNHFEQPTIFTTANILIIKCNMSLIISADWKVGTKFHLFFFFHFTQWSFTCKLLFKGHSTLKSLLNYWSPVIIYELVVLFTASGTKLQTGCLVHRYMLFFLEIA